MSQISIIAAVSDNYAIGKNNKLPWHMPADMKFFKEITTGHALIMGRLTYESLPHGALPNRKNIVLTSIPEGNIGKIYEATSLREAIDLCEKEENVFIMGGASIFKQALEFPGIDSMYITWIHHDFQADVYFPEFDKELWKLDSCERHDADEQNPYPYSFCKYSKN